MILSRMWHYQKSLTIDTAGTFLLKLSYQGHIELINIYKGLAGYNCLTRSVYTSMYTCTRIVLHTL